MGVFFAQYWNKFWDTKVSILIHKAFSLFGKSINGFRRPPWQTITISVILTSLIIKTMSDFMSDDNTDSSIVQVPKIVQLFMYCE
jgi:hypothetical protein